MELKNTMTIEEMTEYMKEHTFILPNRVTVGIFARKLGFKVYKPMRAGRLLHLYVREEEPPRDDIQK